MSRPARYALLGLVALVSSAVAGPGIGGSVNPGPALPPAPEWRSIRWCDEPAFVSESGGWRAVVSLPRARLVHFGPARGATRETNLLWTPATPDDPAGWGGHRQWLGPQSSWEGGWPPPPAWERRAAQEVTVTDGRLALRLADAGHGWPTVTRRYAWDGAGLACTVELAGGHRAAQVVHIFQVATDVVTSVQPEPTPEVPAGFVLLPSVGRAELATQFAPLPHVTSEGPRLQLRHLGVVAKLGFLPRPLRGHSARGTLHLARGAERGTPVGEPDRGFLTQVYLGGTEPFTELEQLSPLYAAGAPAAFTVVLRGELAPSP